MISFGGLEQRKILGFHGNVIIRFLDDLFKKMDVVSNKLKKEHEIYSLVYDNVY